jgi:hypothetical protein
VGGEAIYANEALYANLGGDPVYANVAEVSKIFIEFEVPLLKRATFIYSLITFRRTRHRQSWRFRDVRGWRVERLKPSPGVWAGSRLPSVSPFLVSAPWGSH